VAALLVSLGLDKAPCAVEVNARLVRKSEHPTHALAAGDRVEVVTLVGGG
jgi:sulfur carrier protein